jgi:hypothetical protein
VEAPSELAALSTKERDRSGATKGLTEEELNRFLDELPKDKTTPGDGSRPGRPAPVSPSTGW